MTMTDDTIRTDEHALILFSRMLSRHPVWVDSPANQRVWIQGVGLDNNGKLVAYDHEGNDHLVEEYQLQPRTVFVTATPNEPRLGDS